MLNQKATTDVSEQVKKLAKAQVKTYGKSSAQCKPNPRSRKRANRKQLALGPTAFPKQQESLQRPSDNSPSLQPDENSD